MILRILILACAILHPTLGKMDMKKFTNNFEDLCFQNEESDPFRVNGQEMPLSNTIENFISLVEKFEASNTGFNLKEELAFFLSEFLFENIKFTNGKVDVWKIGRANLHIIDTMWDPDNTGYKPAATNPFTDQEICSLYYMISHSLLQKDIQLLRSYSPGNSSYSKPSRASRSDIDPDEYYPQELGVVSIRGTDAAVSLSKVLIGLYVGLNPNRKSDLLGYDEVKDWVIPDEHLPSDKTVDALYIVTLAEILTQSEWIGSDRPGLSPNGKWVSIPLSEDKSISGFCPMVYKQQQGQSTNLPAYSYSSVRGATDGLLLGLSILPLYSKKNSIKLSQILRMYYSPDGISLETPIEGTTIKRLSFCSRQDLISSVENKLHDQMLSYGYLIAEAWKDVEKVVAASESAYNKHKSQIFTNVNTEIRDYCSRSYNLEKPEDLPRETFLDIIVVMDSSISESSFQEQQMITGNLARQLDLRYTGSRMTILLDQKADWEATRQTGSSSSSKITLKSVVSDTYSSSCAACIVGQIPYEPSTTEREQVIIAINQLLQERKDNETKYSGVNGKVVIYFNYESENGRGNNRIQGRLARALQDLHLNHHDVLFYAIGLDPELLKKYAKNDPSLVFLGTEAPPEEIAKKIFYKLSIAPALLQYGDCKEARNEKGAVYENFVSLHTLQHYEMPAQYFHKSTSITFNFESQNGYIRVCYNRATMTPEHESKNCRNTSTGNTGIEFKMSNPCKSFTESSCSPFYFSIMGMDSSTDMRQDTRARDFCNDIADHWCSNLDQVKFKVSHTGIRCSGCLRIAATPTIILFTILLLHFVHKRL